MTHVDESSHAADRHKEGRWIVADPQPKPLAEPDRAQDIRSRLQDIRHLSIHITQGGWAYYALVCTDRQWSDLQAALSLGRPVPLVRFGQVLCRNFGSGPDPESRADMLRRFGLEWDPPLRSTESGRLPVRT